MADREKRIAQMYREAAKKQAEEARDTVRVVRCKNCIHYEMGACLKIYDDGSAAKEAWHKRKPDDFCSYGERREVQNG